MKNKRRLKNLLDAGIREMATALISHKLHFFHKNKNVLQITLAASLR